MKDLINELADLYLRPVQGYVRDSGLFHRVNSVIGGGKWDGEVSQDAKQISRIKEIIEELQRKAVRK